VAKGDDLFHAAAAERLAARAPLADRLRPARLDDIVGQPHLLAPGAPLRALIETKLRGLPIRPREVVAPPPVIDLMAALKRSLAQDTPAISSTTTKEKRARPAADRRQRSLLLAVAGGRKRKEQPATEPAAVAMKPRKKASRLA